MKKLVFLVVMAFMVIAATAQTVQYGRVVEMNSNGNPVAGVLVTVPSIPNSPSAISNANGVFLLEFDQNHPGDVIRGMRVNKKGYEVVNYPILQEGWTLTRNDTMTIYLAPETMISEARNSYYASLQEAYLNRDDALNPMSNNDVSVGSTSEYEFDFLFKGLGFIESCLYFGDYYLELKMNDAALDYYRLALQMYRTIDGYEGSDFTDQIKQIQSTISKLEK